MPNSFPRADEFIGPLLAMAIADAYGAGFEMTSATYVKKHNRMEGYIPHPKFTQRASNAYTDDTQMALALAQHLLADRDCNHLSLANTWVEGFHRDQRTGYSGNFYAFLCQTTTGAEFVEGIRPDSTKNGGAMRAFPVGFHRDPWKVRDLAMMQASLTHATWGGMMAAAAAALLFHHRYHRLGTKADVVPFLNKWVPGVDWGLAVQTPGDAPMAGPATDGVATVQRAVAVFLGGHSLTDVIQTAVALGGDTDTVAAIAAPAAAVCQETRNALPVKLISDLENGAFGRDYIDDIDGKLRAKFPRLDQPASVKAKAPRVAKKAKEATESLPVPPQEEGPCDFLFR